MAWRAVLPLMDGAMASAVAVATHPTPMEHRQGSPPTRRPKASMREGDSRWVQRLTADPARLAVGTRAAMAWHGVLPLMDGAMASAVTVATHPTSIEHRQERAGRRGVRQKRAPPKASTIRRYHNFRTISGPISLV